MDVTCNPDGSVHWTAVVHNDGDCTVVTAWKSTLQQHARGQGGYRDVAVERGTQAFPPGDTTVQGDFCYDFPSSVNKIRVEFAIDNDEDDCRIKKKSHPENPCDPVGPCPPNFSDVAVEDAYYTPVMSLIANEVASGYADGTFTLIRGTVIQVEMGVMRAGDCNDDNMVTAADFVILKNTFGQTLGQPFYDDRADFNGDTIITAVDFILLKSNFGFDGAPPIGPSASAGNGDTGP